MQEQLIGLLAARFRPVEMAELKRLTGRDERNIATGIVRLARRGLVERLESGRYRLTEAGLAAALDGAAIRPGPKGHHTGARGQHMSTSRANIWKSMRVMRKASTWDLAALTGASLSNVQKYLRLLERAGYVRRLRKERGGVLRWLLIDDTGPLSPVFRPRLGVMLDRNDEVERLMAPAGRGVPS